MATVCPRAELRRGNGMERRTISWTAILAVFLFSASLLCAPRTALAIADDTCVEQGGTADCTGPEVGPYFYTLATWGWTSGSVTSEAQAFALAETSLLSGGVCTVSFDNPPWYPLPPVSGRYRVGDKEFDVVVSSFGMEHNQRKLHVFA